mmetsp:Transcript_42866/g.110535  ORF Transcript_42866/g.110535 Transcript_42866/m.110535 type:complete len:209 (-) Transcript_42866:608-1234(-)
MPSALSPPLCMTGTDLKRGTEFTSNRLQTRSSSLDLERITVGIPLFFGFTRDLLFLTDMLNLQHPAFLERTSIMEHNRPYLQYATMTCMLNSFNQLLLFSTSDYRVLETMKTCPDLTSMHAKGERTDEKGKEDRRIPIQEEEGVNPDVETFSSTNTTPHPKEVLLSFLCDWLAAPMKKMGQWANLYVLPHVHKMVDLGLPCSARRPIC